MPDLIPVGKDIESLEKSQAVVSHNLSEGPPTTENILENKGGESGAVLCPKHSPLGVRGQGAAGLDNIPVAAQPGHYHSVKVSLVKKATNHWHGWGNMEAGGLANLTLMAGVHKLFYIVDQHWPPEAEEQMSLDCKDTFVPEVIMSLLNKSVPLVLRYH